MTIERIEKEVIKELDKRGGIRWGLATSLKYYETMAYICELLSEVKRLTKENEFLHLEQVSSHPYYYHKWEEAEAEVKRLQKGGDTSFLGHPVEYWIELDSYAKGNMYEKLVEKICELEAEVKRLQIHTPHHFVRKEMFDTVVKKLDRAVEKMDRAEAEVKRLEEALTIKTLENAKGAQVLSDVEDENKRLRAILLGFKGRGLI